MKRWAAVPYCVAITLASSAAFAQKEEMKPHGFWSGLGLIFAGKHLLIRCIDGKQRASDDACTGEVSGVLGWADWPYYSSYKINTSTGAVLETTGYFVSGKLQNDTPHFLENCRVLDASNWRCDTHVQISPGNKTIDDGWHDGMKNGRAYRYATTDGAPDYYGSSISGLELLMFETALIDLKSAARGDVFYGLFRHG
jgi:hypothetical protein